MPSQYATAVFKDSTVGNLPYVPSSLGDQVFNNWEVDLLPS
jgi:hypothetical protein